MCHYHQTAPESGFTQHHTCTIATPQGRVTVGESHLVVITGTLRQESTFPDAATRQRALLQYCGIDLTSTRQPPSTQP